MAPARRRCLSEHEWATDQTHTVRQCTDGGYSDDGQRTKDALNTAQRGLIKEVVYVIRTVGVIDWGTWMLTH